MIGSESEAYKEHPFFLVHKTSHIFSTFMLSHICRGRDTIKLVTYAGVNPTIGIC